MRVSVIVNVFNGEAHLREAIDSVLAQTMSELELLVVDDGSTDNTAEIVKQFMSTDPRVKLLQQANQGIAAAMNLGLSEAKCDWVAHLDADDRMHPERLEWQLEYVSKHPKVSVLASYATMVNNRGQPIGFSRRPVDSDRAIRELQPREVLEIVHSSVLMSRQALESIGNYPSGHPGVEDRELWSRLATAGYRLTVLPELLTEYRLHGNSLTAQRAKSMTRLGLYIDANFIRRAQGQPAISWEIFGQLMERRSRLRRWMEYRESTAHIWYLNAARSYAEGRRGRCVLYALMSTTLRPIATTQRAFSKVGQGRRNQGVDLSAPLRSR